MDNQIDTQNLKNDNQNKNKYSKIGTNEDTYLELKDNKINNSYSESNNNEEDKNNKIIGNLNKRKSYYFYMKLGKTFTFFADKDGSPLIVIGPHWIMYLCCCSIVTIIFISFFLHFWKYMNIFFQLTGLIVFLVFFISYTYTFLCNPGIPKYDENAILGKPRDNYRFCRKCGIWTNMEDNTCHCFDCDVCYEGYDHHCPWTGKCIAKKNVTPFYIFIVSVLCSFCYFVTALTHAQHNIYLINKNNKKL